MRYPARLVVFACALALAGCGAVVRPDAQVARAVEKAELKSAGLIALASADDVLPVALPVGGAPVPEHAVVGDSSTIDAEAQVAAAWRARAAQPFFTAWPPPSPRSYSPSPQPHPWLVDPSEAADGSRPREGKKGLPNLRFEVFKFNINGQPVGVKASLKDKHLMFAFKMTF